MPPRTRSATGTLKRKSTHLDLNLSSDLDPELDADFLALSRRQRREVDRAYDRALRDVGGRGGRGGTGRKKRKVDSKSTMVDEGGGFVVDDEDVEMGDGGGGGGGGFIPDEEDGSDIISDHPGATTTTTTTTASSPHLLPLSALPATIESLGLEWDTDVLAVFQSQSMDQSTGATKRDFRAVCAAMMEVEQEGEVDEEQVGGDDEFDMDDDSEDEYKGVGQEDDGLDSPLSSISDDEDDKDNDNNYNDTNPSNKSRRRHRQPPPPTTTTSDPSMRIDNPQIKLSHDQKQFISRMWETMFEGSTRERGQRLLGREQVKRWAGIMGETWGDDELTEMIQLFSTQPGKRGLSYEDFTTLLIRGGLV